MRKPYLQSAIGDSVSILWRTNEGTRSQVEYKQVDANQWMTVAGVTRKTNTKLIENEVTLKNLNASTIYQYRIFTDNQHLQEGEEFSFISPVEDQDSIFSFFAVGDVGEPVAEGGTPDLLGKALAKYVDSVSFGLLLGDIIYPDGKSEDYDKNLFDHFGEVFPYVPVFTILGNHDWHDPEENYIQEWKLPGNEHYYSFEAGNAHFIGLDTKNGELYEYDKQVEWLVQDLSKVTEDIDWKIVFLHHNGKSCTYKKDYEGVVSLYPIFDKYGVDLVLNGHAHTYERLNPMNGDGEVDLEGVDDTTYDHPTGFVSITVGSGGKLRGIGSDPKPFEPDPDACQYENLVAAYAHQWAFLKLSVEGKKITGRAISTENLNVIDQFEIVK